MRTCVGFVLLLCLGAAEAAGQVRPERTFDTCGLRVEGARVVRGSGGESVARLGPFGNTLQEVVVGSDSAVAYALASDRQRGWAMLWTVVALVSTATATWGYYTNFWEFEPGAAHYTGLGIGISSAMASVLLQSRSSHSLQKSLWWYNRDLCSGGGN